MKKAKRAYTKYSQEFKKRVIMNMREHRLSCHETVRKLWGVGTRAETDSFRRTVLKLMREMGLQGKVRRRFGNFYVYLLRGISLAQKTSLRTLETALRIASRYVDFSENLIF